MANAVEHLSKDRQLELGWLIQGKRQAEEELALGNTDPNREAELQIVIDKGTAAIDEMVRSNMGLVYSRARDFKSKLPSGPDLEDLVQEGMTGLMTAIHKYDPSMDNKFSTLAFYWIYQSISRGVNKTHRLVRLPENRITDYSGMVKVMNKYTDKDLTQAEIQALVAEETGLSKVEIINILNAASTHTSLNKTVGSDDSTKELIEVIGESHQQGSAEHSAAAAECQEILAGTLDKLEGLKRKIVAAQYNLEFEGEYLDSKTLKEEEGLTASKYRRLLSEGLRDLKEELTAKGLTLQDFLE